MGSTETLHLRWNEYEPNIKNGFSQLRNDEDFYDVTLACGNKQIKAHKVILGACSSFFKSLLKSVSHQHPLLYLGGIDYNHLESVLAFMYNGEVKVKPEELDHFLAVAQELKVNGLMHNRAPANINECSYEESRHFKEENPPGRSIKRESSLELPVPNKKIAIIKKEDSEVEDINVAESSSSSSYVQSDSHFEYTNDPSTYEPEIAEDDSNNIDQDRENQLNVLLDARISEFVSRRDSDKKFRCLKCSYSSANKKDVTRHIEARHFQTDGFPCDKCGRRYKTRDSRDVHYRKAHKGEMEYFSTGNI